MGGEATTYTYDPRGLMTRAQNSAATVTCQYDAAGRLLSEAVNGVRCRVPTMKKVSAST